MVVDRANVRFALPDTRSDLLLGRAEGRCEIWRYLAARNDNPSIHQQDKEKVVRRLTLLSRGRMFESQRSNHPAERQFKRKSRPGRTGPAFSTEPLIALP
jgi:hypothetical protein